MYYLLMALSGLVMGAVLAHNGIHIEQGLWWLIVVPGAVIGSVVFSCLLGRRLI